MIRDYYSVVLPKDKAKVFTGYLRESGIQFEPSEHADHVYIACLLTPAEAADANAFIAAC